MKGSGEADCSKREIGALWEIGGNQVRATAPPRAIAISQPQAIAAQVGETRETAAPERAITVQIVAVETASVIEALPAEVDPATRVPSAAVREDPAGRVRVPAVPAARRA